MKSPTGQFNSGSSSGAIFSTSVPKLKALRALGCRLEHEMLFCCWHLNAENGNPQNCQILTTGVGTSIINKLH